MPSDRLSAKSRIEQLVRYFEQNIHQLKSPAFNETQARQQLIDPLFEALGWDVTNRSMKPLYLQEVVSEGRVKTSSEVHEQHALFETKHALGKDYKEYASILDYIAEDNYKASAKEAIKKPDYRFRSKGQTKFFVEAKKPFVDLAKSQDAIFQVKRYGFSGRVPVSILTDFEEFRVFDCTHRPFYEKPTLGVIKNLDLTYKQYRDQFDLLYDTFAREAVEAGSLDSLTKKLLNKRTGDFALDKTFLEDLSAWREELARDIAKHPKNRRLLNDVTLNESVQRILDRIVFFRVCEDREIEVENTLLAIVRMWKERPGLSLYSLLNELFKKRRELYNGLLFSPHECEQLEIGDKVILKILENLNYPFSPYHFNEIGVEILGSIYEKFLGKTIHLTAKTVRVDEKPEVRKAGGVYYTPQYIVDYIVANTVGRLLYEEHASTSSHLKGVGAALSMTTNEKPRHPERSESRLAGQTESKGAQGRKLKLSPTQVAKLKIIDIACGSGSFLLGAFQQLIEYHAEWYSKNPKDIKTVNGVPDAYTDASGNLRLSSRKKRDILVNNIYGVDIDRQAVEVTQMSLYLKVLESENSETLNPQMTLALKEVYLPPLADNIKCGNSLIGTDIGSQGELFHSDGSVGARLASSSAGTGQALSLQKINPFDWESAVWG
jgi:type I restriction-modification system DNA methylase subunit